MPIMGVRLACAMAHPVGVDMFRGGMSRAASRLGVFGTLCNPRMAVVLHQVEVRTDPEPPRRRNP